MRNRKMLASSLLAGALLSVGYVAYKPITVHALTDMSVKDTQNPLKISLIPTAGGSSAATLLVDLQRNSNTNDSTSLYFDLVNKDTGTIAASHYFGKFDGNSRLRNGINLLLIEDGLYHLDIYSVDDFGKRYFGRTEIFKISDKEYYPIKKSEVPKETETPKQEEPKSTVQSGWSGNSYYQNGVKVVNKWIFDIQYNSYFFININGNYVQNAWSGNYYLKSGGYMAKSEWIYDKNYGSYYYLTSEGSYARNTWVGNYYLKSDGKMAKSEWIYDKNYGSYYYLTSEGSYARNTWVGNYYLKSDGKMAKSEWIYDKNYDSYYYLTSEGSYARNTWVGNYYLKSDGKMAKSEWIYDKNYDSYYYLTSEGSYARNTWVGNYYLKSNGKMAVKERTPDGYQVDSSGKWVK